MSEAAVRNNLYLVRIGVVVALLALLGGAGGAAAQEFDVARRTYTFLDDRLIVQVVTDAPGELRVVRGQRGRVEVAGRALDGFVGFGLGGEMTRQLRLTSVGGEHVEYLLVVPEHVNLTVQLPERRGGDMGPRQPSAVYRWGGEGAVTADQLLLPTLGGLYLIHSSRWAPAVLDIPELAAVRSISVRFEGESFRIAASRPLTFEPGTAGGGIVLSIAGEPTDLSIYVPRGSAPFVLRSGGQRLVTSIGDRPTSDCTTVAVQRPTQHQTWFSIYPQNGRVSCR